MRIKTIQTSNKNVILKYFRCRDGKRTETRIGMEGICITHSCIPPLWAIMCCMYTVYSGMQEWVIQIPSIPILVSVLFPSLHLKYFRIKFLLLVLLWSACVVWMWTRRTESRMGFFLFLLQRNCLQLLWIQLSASHEIERSRRWWYVSVFCSSPPTSYILQTSYWTISLEAELWTCHTIRIYYEQGNGIMIDFFTPISDSVHSQYLKQKQFWVLRLRWAPPYGVLILSLAHFRVTCAAFDLRHRKDTIIFTSQLTCSHHKLYVRLFQLLMSVDYPWMFQWQLRPKSRQTSRVRRLFCTSISTLDNYACS